MMLNNIKPSWIEGGSMNIKKKISGLLALAIVVFLATSGILEGFMNFMIWLVSLNNTQSEVSIVGERFVKVATFLISYAAVGFVFNKLGWYDSDVMKFAYFIVSTRVSFGLCYIVMLLETYIVSIAIVLAIFILIGIGVVIYLHCRKKRKNNK